MPDLLYLDDARFGRIRPQCQDVLLEFAELQGVCGQVPAFDGYMAEGGSVWSNDVRANWPRLAAFDGIEALRGRICRAIGADANAFVLLAQSSHELVRAAATILFQSCERVLGSDRDWPEFHRLVDQEAGRSGGVLHHTRLPESASTGERLAREFQDQQCDGMLLTPVSSGGRDLDVDELQKQLPEDATVLIDGAQQLGHVPIPQLRQPTIYLGGFHKWLRSGVPLSFAVFHQIDERRRLEQQFRRFVGCGALRDPILIHTMPGQFVRPRVTLRIDALLAANEALRCFLTNQYSELRLRRANARRINDELGRLDPINTAVLSVRHELPCEVVSRVLTDRNIAASITAESAVRLACPAQAMSDDQVRRVVELAEVVSCPTYVANENPDFPVRV